VKRRRLLQSSLLLGAGLGWQSLLPLWARSALATTEGLPALQGRDFDLTIAGNERVVAGRRTRAITLNGQFPAPLLRWREGDELTLRIHNQLQEDSSIHWHGILLPWQMDGVPGVSFPGIAAGDSFTYRFALKQAGTYWYHSHSGLQEQLGHYGPIIIDPQTPEPYDYQREYVILLSDWSFEDPQRVFAKLKKMSDTYNFQQRTLRDFFRDLREEGLDGALASRMMWGDMRMNASDLADVTAATYTYLVNGHSPAENWTGLFKPGERIRLRFINASSMSIFNVRIPGLPLTVIQSDGLPVVPVETDEFQIGTAETYDVLVQPQAAQAYTVMAETNDFSGYARATLAPQAGMQAAVPALRPRPLLTMQDMGMAHEAHADHAGHDAAACTPEHAAMGHCRLPEPQRHDHARGPGVASVAEHPQNRLHERPLGLQQEQHRVLVYTDLRSPQPNPDQRAPQRELELHLTANMERYMWSFDGLKFSEVGAPIPLQLGERLRLTFVNDSMMPHPLHLHGMFFELVNGQGAQQPRKHTLVLKPGEKASVDLTADAEGDWAFHCHLLYHMHAGMMRVFSVRAVELPA
jgi:CopA family copper-resistance protein